MPVGPTVGEEANIVELNELSKAAEISDLRFSAAEKGLFRTLNKSVLFPIQGTLGETWQNISVCVQIHLGALEWPNENDMGSLRKKVAQQKRLIFDRMNRLLRCFIDCRIFDGDAVGVRNGLELARSIAAGFWEGQASQLQQVPNVGPVAARKLASYNVTSVLQLANTEFQDIERMLSRNPPYGKKLLEQLEGFPRLAVDATILTPQLSRKNADSDTTVTLEVQLDYINSKGVPCWRSTIPAVTFMAETSDGRLCHFWRSNIKNAHGINIKFPVPLTRTEGLVKCSFSCEDIVGTQVVATCRTPPSRAAADATEKPEMNRKEGASALNTRPPKAETGIPNDAIFDDLDDEDMLGALGASETPDEPANEEYPDIMEILNTSSFEPVKMKNGRWLCNHTCRGGGLTKGGKPCSHKCCHEGLEKPRPPPSKKDKEKGKKADRNEGAKKPSKEGKKEAKRKHIDDENDGLRSWAPAKKHRHSQSLDDDLKELDLIDLSILADEDKPEATQNRPQAAKTPRDASYVGLDLEPFTSEEGPATVHEAPIEPGEATFAPGSKEDGGTCVLRQVVEENGNWPPLLGADPFAVAMDVRRAPSPGQEVPAWLAEMGKEMLDLVHGVVEMEEDGYRP